MEPATIALVINTAINGLKALFGGGGPPYAERLSRACAPVARERGLPVLAIVNGETGNGELIGFFPDGRVSRLATGVSGASLGGILDEVMDSLGAAILCQTIEPATFADIGDGIYAGGTVTPDAGPGLPAATQAGFGNNMLIFGLGLAALFLIMRKK